MANCSLLQKAFAHSNTDYFPTFVINDSRISNNPTKRKEYRVTVEGAKSVSVDPLKSVDLYQEIIISR